VHDASLHPRCLLLETHAALAAMIQAGLMQ